MTDSGGRVSIIQNIEYGIEQVGKFYTHYFYCSNCGNGNYEYVKRGVRCRGVSEECPKCGCLTYKG